MESAIRFDVHSTCPALVAPVDAFPDASHANRFAGSCFLPAEARWASWQALSNLEVPNDEGEY